MSVRNVTGSRTAVSIRAESTASPRESGAETPAAPVRYNNVYSIGSNDETLKYLDGSLPGDFGWDPLKLGKPIDRAGYNFQDLEWLSYAELIHGRWAMLGAAGVLVPDFFGRWGIIPKETAVPWFESGGIYPGGIPFFGEVTGAENYWADPKTLFVSMMFFMSFAEHRRIQDFRKPGSLKDQPFLGMEAILGGSGEPKYPGGQFFNMFNMATSPEYKQERREQEIKHGRLAMLAMAGFAAQSYATRVSPIDNINNFFSGNNDAIRNADSANIAAFMPWIFIIVFSSWLNTARKAAKKEKTA